MTGQPAPAVASRGIASTVMRGILVEYAHARHAVKRRGGIRSLQHGKVKISLGSPMNVFSPVVTRTVMRDGPLRRDGDPTL
jgi:hypothetical protein